MAIVTKKVYKTVELAAGESFVLPPNSKLIAASDMSLLSSNCELPTPEPMACYEAWFGYNADNNETEIVDTDTITAVYLGDDLKGTYLISDIYGGLPPETIPFLTPMFPAGMITDEVVTVTDDVADTLSFKVVFKTTPTIAAALKFQMSARGFSNIGIPDAHGTWFYPVTSTDCTEPEV